MSAADGRPRAQYVPTHTTDSAVTIIDERVSVTFCERVASSSEALTPMVARDRIRLPPKGTRMALRSMRPVWPLLEKRAYPAGADEVALLLVQRKCLQRGGLCVGVAL